MTVTVDPVYLLPYVRLNLGDTNPLAYRYTDAWLTIAIQASIKALGAWWKDKYLLDAMNLVYRNINAYFEDPTEPPVILSADERPIVLMAAVIVLQGSLENSAWDLSSWRDNEISYSNLEGGRIRNSNLQRLWDELLYLMLPPTKKLSGTMKGSLPGYIGNDSEWVGPL